MIAPTVKVKPMVWEGDEAEDHDLTAQPDPYHRYTVRKLDETRFDVILNHELGSLWFKIVKGQVWTDYTSAKAAAQADYEARILSAIDTTDLKTHIGAVLAEAANTCGKNNGPWRSSAWECREAILALRPTALTALDRAKREARVDVFEQVWTAIGKLHGEATAVDALNAIAPICALIAAERGKP